MAFDAEPTHELQQSKEEATSCLATSEMDAELGSSRGSQPLEHSPHCVRQSSTYLTDSTARREALNFGPRGGRQAALDGAIMSLRGKKAPPRETWSGQARKRRSGRSTYFATWPISQGRTRAEAWMRRRPRPRPREPVPPGRRGRARLSLFETQVFGDREVVDSKQNQRQHSRSCSQRVSSQQLNRVESTYW